MVITKSQRINLISRQKQINTQINDLERRRARLSSPTMLRQNRTMVAHQNFQIRRLEDSKRELLQKKEQINNLIKEKPIKSLVNTEGTKSLDENVVQKETYISPSIYQSRIPKAFNRRRLMR